MFVEIGEPGSVGVSVSVSVVSVVDDDGTVGGVMPTAAASSWVSGASGDRCGGS